MVVMQREASTTLNAIGRLFPRFAKLAASRDPEHVLPPATPAEVEAIEASAGVRLPGSYKQLLRITRGFWLMGGVVQFGKQHPFFHRFPALEELTPQQRSVVAMKGGPWPPASDGMLCFAEFFIEADGDQVLFDVSRGLVNGEYPVMYWAHEGRPPSVRKLAATFAQFMEECLSYPALQNDDED
jgi:hypothetical protein